MADRKRDLPKLQPNYKLWLEYKGEYVFGPGAYSILKSIEETGTITEGAKKLGMSYRYAWGVVRKIEDKLADLGVNEKLLRSYKGGTVGGGGADVTEFGKSLMNLFSSVDNSFSSVVEKHQS